MLKVEYLIAKIGVDTTENEPFQIKSLGGVHASFQRSFMLLQSERASLARELGLLRALELRQREDALPQVALQSSHDTSPRHITLSEARSRLYQRWFLVLFTSK